MDAPHSYTAQEWLDLATRQLNSLHTLFKDAGWQPDCTLIQGLEIARGQINEALQIIKQPAPTPEHGAEDVRLLLKAFDDGIFVRDASRDAEPGWALKLIKPLAALGRLSVRYATHGEGQK